MQSKPKKTQRALRKAKHLLTIALVTLTLTSCCKIKSQWVTIVEDGYLKTPDGQYPFKQLSYSELQRINSNYGHNDISPAPKTYMVAEATDFFVIANPARGGGSEWNIHPKINAGTNYRIEINQENSFFETRHKEKLVKSKKLQFSPVYNHNKPSMMIYSTDIPSMIDSNSIKDHTFRYVIPFSMNQNEHLIDVTISIGHSSYLNCSDWHVPGSP